MKSIEIWTDGSCFPNPGKGAWAFAVIENGTLIKECSGFEEGVTNNRMEYQALIEAFNWLEDEQLIPDESITICSDSNLLVQTINEWIDRWEKNGWRRKVGRSFKPVANLDLVKRLYEIKQTWAFTIKWVKGHADIKWNEYCDQLCRKEFHNRNLKCFEDIYPNGR